MNRAERRRKAREMTKGREDRRSIARALKTIQLAEGDPDPEPYSNLRAAGFVVAKPRLALPRERDG